jgi:DNA modification methylase
MSFPDRGKWGDSSWRGNCSGHVLKALFEQTQPATFVDCMAGSGTSIEVAREMGIHATGLDIHHGFNAVRDSILDAVGHEVDLAFSHPPYGEIILYSAHPDDLSRCASDEDFHQKLQMVLLNQRQATRPGGHYATLIGDKRKQGKYCSYQAEAIARMPADELVSVQIKIQHNCVSDSRTYARMSWPRIAHEYLLVWKRREAPLLVLLGNIAREQQARLSGTWKNLVRLVLQRYNGQASLQDIYATISKEAPEKLATNPNWQAKIRQVLNSNETMFASTDRGVWSLA